MNFHYLKSHFSDLLDVNMNIVKFENPYCLELFLVLVRKCHLRPQIAKLILMQLCKGGKEFHICCFESESELNRELNHVLQEKPRATGRNRRAKNMFRWTLKLHQKFYV